MYFQKFFLHLQNWLPEAAGFFFVKNGPQVDFQKTFQIFLKKIAGNPADIYSYVCSFLCYKGLLGKANCFFSPLHPRKEHFKEICGFLLSLRVYVLTLCSTGKLCASPCFFFLCWKVSSLARIAISPCGGQDSVANSHQGFRNCCLEIETFSIFLRKGISN